MPCKMQGASTLGPRNVLLEKWSRPLPYTASKGLLLSLTPKTKRKETPANVCTKLALQMQTYEMT